MSATASRPPRVASHQQKKHARQQFSSRYTNKQANDANTLKLRNVQATAAGALALPNAANVTP